MKNFKKIITLTISLCIIFSFIMTSPIYASTDDSANTKRPNITDVVPESVETNTYYFYKPEGWEKVGVYWYEGSYNCELEDNKVNGRAWPGYEVIQTEESDKNIYLAKIPKDVKYVQFNNLIDGEGQCYTSNIGNYDGNSKIYVSNGNQGGIENETSTVWGELLFYYGDGKYGTYKTLEEAQANNAVYSGGEFPKTIEKNEPTEPETIAKKDNKMKVTVTTKTVKAKKLKTTKVTVKAVTVKNNNGTVNFTKIAKKSSNRLTVNAKTGKITVKKGTNKGNYKIKVKITAKGTKKYNPKTVIKTVKIKVQ